MATSKKKPSFDFAAAVERATAQFRDLNPNDPGQWPLMPQAAVWLLAASLVVVAGWFLLLSGVQDELEAERGKEPALKLSETIKAAGGSGLHDLSRVRGGAVLRQHAGSADLRHAERSSP